MAQARTAATPQTACMVASKTNLGAKTAHSMRCPRCTDTFAADKKVRTALSRSVRADSRSMAYNTLVAASFALVSSSYDAAMPVFAACGGRDDDSGGGRSPLLFVAASTPAEAGDHSSALPPVALPLPLLPVNRNDGSCTHSSLVSEAAAAAAARGSVRAARISVPNVLRKSSRPPTLKSKSSKPGRVHKRSSEQPHGAGQPRVACVSGEGRPRVGTRSEWRLGRRKDTSYVQQYLYIPVNRQECTDV